MKIIRVCDVETTGLGPEAEVLELGRADIFQTPGWAPPMDPGEREWALTRTHPQAQLFGIQAGRIPPEARAVHHIDAFMVAGLETFKAKGLQHLFMDLLGPRNPTELLALAAHQVDYERQYIDPLLTQARAMSEGGYAVPPVPEKVEWICTYKCALRQWPDAPSHGNFALLYWLEDAGAARQIERVDRSTVTRAHRAGPDALVTAVLLTELLRHQSIETLIQWTSEPRWLTKVPVGEHRGKRWDEIDMGLLEWFLKKDFDADVKAAAMREVDRRIAERRSAQAQGKQQRLPLEGEPNG